MSNDWLNRREFLGTTFLGMLGAGVASGFMEAIGEEPKPSEPETTTEEKWRITALNLSSFAALSIVYIKSLGKSRQDFSTFAGKALAPTYEKLKGKRLAEIAHAMLDLYSKILPDYKYEIKMLTATSAEIKVNHWERDKAEMLKPLGLSSDELEMFYIECVEQEVNYLGYSFSEVSKVDDGWNIKVAAL